MLRLYNKYSSSDSFSDSGKILGRVTIYGSSHRGAASDKSVMEGGNVKPPTLITSSLESQLDQRCWHCQYICAYQICSIRYIIITCKASIAFPAHSLLEKLTNAQNLSGRHLTLCSFPNLWQALKGIKIIICKSQETSVRLHYYY